jgi:hypothetical protein
MRERVEKIAISSAALILHLLQDKASLHCIYCHFRISIWTCNGVFAANFNSADCTLQSRVAQFCARQNRTEDRDYSPKTKRPQSPVPPLPSTSASTENPDYLSVGKMMHGLRRNRDDPNKLQRCNSDFCNQSEPGRSHQARNPESALHEQIPKNLEIADGKRVLRSAILGNGGSRTVKVTTRLIRRVKNRRLLGQSRNGYKLQFCLSIWSGGEMRLPWRRGPTGSTQSARAPGRLSRHRLGASSTVPADRRC